MFHLCEIIHINNTTTMSTDPTALVKADIRKLVQIIIDLGQGADPGLQVICERKAKKYLDKYRIKKRLRPKFKSINN